MAEYKWFNTQGTVELPAEHYDALTVGSQKFRDAARTDRITTFAPGLYDDNLVPQTVAIVQDGVIDEYELVITPKEMTTTLHGRDQMAILLDTYFKTRYLRAPRASVTTVVEDPSIVQVVGQFNASLIAQQAVAFAGLGLSWEVPDYELQEDFDGVGRIIDVLKRLIQPWTQVEPYRADIFIQNNVVIIRPRNPGAPADYTYGITNFRRKRIAIRKRPGKKFGTVTLLGLRQGDTQTQNPGGGIGNIWIEGEQTEEETIETFAPGGGGLLSVTTITTTFKMPGRNVTHAEKTVFTVVGGIPQLTSKETIDNEWEPVMIDTAGPVNQYIQNSQLVVRSGVDPNDGKFKVLAQEETGFDHDFQGFTTGETTLKTALSSDTGNLENSSLVVKTYHDLGPLLSELQTEQFSWDSDKKQWNILSRDTQQQSGRRPGGPGRGLPIKKKTADGKQSPGGSTQISLSQTLSTDPDAIDVTYSNVNLNLAQLQLIMNQFIAAQALWEYEILVDGTQMPWLRRGNYIQINDLFAEDNVTEIVLPVMMITEVNTKFDMSSQRSESTSQMRAFGWRST